MSRPQRLALAILSVALAQAPSAFAADPPRSAIVVARRGESPPPAALRARADTLNAAAERAFDVTFDRAGRHAEVLARGRMVLPGENVAERVRSLAAAYGELLGIDPSLGLEVSPRAEGRRAHVRFTSGGIPVESASAIVLFDAEGRVVGGRFDPPASARALGAFVIDAAGARERAVAAADAAVLAAGRTPPAWKDVALQQRWLATDAGLVPTWQVELRGNPRGANYDGRAVFVDARDGATLRVTARVDRASAIYPFFGNGVLFKTKSGKGKVYKTVNHALAQKALAVTLTDISTGIPAPVNQGIGLLTGAFADMWDNAGADPISPSLNFSFDPVGATADRFDVANCYYHLTTFAKARTKRLKTTLASAFSLPILVNVASNEPNAFFSSDPFPVDMHNQGFMAFFDLSAALGPQADFSRDPSIVDHEYTHGWLFYEGLGFSGASDDPARAMNEGIADTFSMYHQNDTIIGKVMEPIVLQGFGISTQRNLQDDDRFPETTAAAAGLTMSGLPEEHRNGEIMGSFFLDVRGALGVGKAETLAFAALPFMPRQTADIGYPNVTPMNAFAATEDFFFACVLGMVQPLPLKDTKSLGAVIGSATARGIIGVPGFSFNTLAVNLEVIPSRKVKYVSKFVRPGDTHYYLFQTNPGRKVSVTLAAAKQTQLVLDFVADGAQTSPGFQETQAKKVQNGGRLVKQAGLVTLLPAGSTYVVVVDATNDTVGGYTLTIDA